MRKTIFLLTSCLCAILLFTACSREAVRSAIGTAVQSGLTADEKPNDAQQDPKAAAFITAFFAGDADAAMSEFSQTAVEKISRFTEELQTTRSFCRGDLISFDLGDGKRTSKKNYYGATTEVAHYYYTVETTEATYEFAFVEQLQDSEIPENVGLTTVYIYPVAEERPSSLWQDMEATAGIAFFSSFDDYVVTPSVREIVVVDLEQSTFSDFTIEGDKVVFVCRIALNNSAETTQSISLLGDFKEDQEHGLLKEDMLFASLSLSGEDVVIDVPPGNSVYTVYFCGTYGGTPQKVDRLLPELLVIEG